MDALWSLSINNLVHGHVNACQCDKCGRGMIRSSVSRDVWHAVVKGGDEILIFSEPLPVIRNHYFHGGLVVLAQINSALIKLGCCGWPFAEQTVKTNSVFASRLG